MRYVEIAIKQCRNGGIDCKIHGLHVVGRKRCEEDEFASTGTHLFVYIFISCLFIFWSFKDCNLISQIFQYHFWLLILRNGKTAPPNLDGVWM